MVQRYDGSFSTSNEASPGLAPMRLVVAALRKDAPVYEQPRLQLPLPAPRYEEARVRPQAEETERSPTRGVHVFDMV